MNARLATVLSLTGVLVAGSAAALVNTQVLNSSVDGTTVQLAGQPTQVGNSLPPFEVPIVTSTGGADTAAADAQQAVYQVDQAGVVTLSKAGDVLTIVSIEPSPGWLVTKAEQDDPFTIEVSFQTGFTEIEFEANLLFGVVGTSVEANTLPSPVGTSGTGGTTVSTSFTPITITSTPISGSVEDDVSDDSTDDSTDVSTDVSTDDDKADDKTDDSDDD